MNSDSEIIKTDLGSEAKHYLVEYLSTGRSLARLLLETVQNNTGHMFAYLPSDIEPEYLRVYEYGFRMNSRITTRCLIDFIRDELRKNPAQLLTIESRCNSSDPWLSERCSRVKFLGEHFYHVCSQIDDAEFILETIKEGSIQGWFIAAITSFPSADNLEWLNNEEMSCEELTVIGRNATYVIIYGWDDEGYIYWKRD